MRNFLVPVVIALSIFSCKKQKYEHLPETGDRERDSLTRGMKDKTYVWTKAIDTKGTNLLQTKWPCIADDTCKAMTETILEMVQGPIRCDPGAGTLELGWFIGANHQNEPKEVWIYFPLPIPRVIYDTSGNVVRRDNYSEVKFYKYAQNGEPHFKYDSLFNLEFIFHTDTTEEHYYLSTIKD